MKTKIIMSSVVLLLSSCSSQRAYEPTAMETAEAARSIAVLNSAPSSSVVAQPGVAQRSNAVQRKVVTKSDLIAAQDTLDVNVFKVADLSAKNLIVESSGMISLPLIGSVQVKGLTITQAEQKVTQLLTKFMQDPKVSITRTDKAVTKRVTVEGEVKTPGVFPIKGNLSFLQAIAMAQGLSAMGDSQNVLFYRDGSQHRINLDLVRKGQIPDPILRSDDRIVVLKDARKVREKKVLDYLPVITAPLSILPGL